MDQLIGNGPQDTCQGVDLRPTHPEQRLPNCPPPRAVAMIGSGLGKGHLAKAIAFESGFLLSAVLCGAEGEPEADEGTARNCPGVQAEEYHRHCFSDECDILISQDMRRWWASSSSFSSKTRTEGLFFILTTNHIEKITDEAKRRLLSNVYTFGL